MSDFLSNFSGDDYKGKMPKKKQEKSKEKPQLENEKKEAVAVPEIPENLVSEEPKRRRKKRRTTPSTASAPRELFDNPQLLDEADEIVDEKPKKVLEIVPTDDNYESDDLHEVEIDPSYQKKQRNKKIAIVGGVVLTVVIGYVTYYQMTRVKMPNFVDKSVTDVRK